MTLHRIPHRLKPFYYRPDGTSEKPWRCDKCNAAFRHYKELHVHKVEAHSY